MTKKQPSRQTAKWFFILVSALTLFLFWKILQPFILVMITAGIFSILLTPIDRKLQTFVKKKNLSALIILLGVFLVVLVPLFILGVLIVQEASDVVSWSIDRAAWLQQFDLRSYYLFQQLPFAVQDQVLAIDFVAASTGVAEWAFTNLGGVFSKSVTLIFQTFIFFVVLYYFLIDREFIRKFVLDMSPLADKIDSDIVKRITNTVRSVVFGKLIVGFVQAILGTIGLLVFGVPGALLWGSLIVITAQIPMLGAGLVMLPSAGYLVLTGHIGAAIALAIWSIAVVGLVDNFLTPLLVGRSTKMPEMLILISILGGLQFFGPIGLILGPTVLAGVMVLVDLYRSGILEE